MFLDEGGDKGLGQMNSVVILTMVIAFRIPPALLASVQAVPFLGATSEIIICIYS